MERERVWRKYDFPQDKLGRDSFRVILIPEEKKGGGGVKRAPSKRITSSYAPRRSFIFNYAHACMKICTSVNRRLEMALMLETL